MGCACFKGTNTKKIVISPEKLIMNNPKSTSQQQGNNDHMGVAISQATFVSEKNYKTFINEYETLEFLGRGAFGIVQKVKHKITKQMRAMKLINKAAFKKSQDETNLLREIEILKKLVSKLIK